MLVDKKYVSVKFSRAKLKRRHEALAVLYDIGSDLTSSLGLPEILDRAMVKVCHHFKVDAVRIYVMDETQTHLNLAAYKGIPQTQVDDLRRIEVGEGFSGKAARTRSLIAQRVSDLENGTRVSLLHRKGFNVIICVPLIVKDRVVGVMNLASKRMITLSEERIDLLIAIGNQIAIAINVAELYADLEKKVEEIKEKKRELEFFAYTMSHDLKNPAIGIAGFASLMSKKYGHKLDEKGKMYCEHMRRAAEQIERFTTDINAYIKSTKAPLRIEKTDVRKIITDIRHELSPTLRNRKIKWSEPRTIPEIMADRMGITRVLRNLIDNALKHAGKGLTKIAIAYDQDKDFHLFSVANDGASIETHEPEEVFRAFRRLPASAETEGTGLGLSIVKEIVESHRGKVWFESKPNDTRFHVSVSKHLRP
jgi:signal transduction histidine kinase